MTKQEEIREVVLGFINLITACPAEGNDVEVFTDDLLKILNDLSVVIKADDLPILTKKGTYERVEPLI